MQRASKQALRLLREACSIEEIDHVFRNYTPYLNKRLTNRKFTCPKIIFVKAEIDAIENGGIYLSVIFKVESKDTDHTRIDIAFGKTSILEWEKWHPRPVGDAYKTTFWFPARLYPEIVALHNLMSDDHDQSW